MNTNPFSPLAEYSYSDELIDRDELISIDPQRVYFMYELNKPMLSSFQLSNDSDEYVAFRVKTTNLKKYSVQPRKGIVLPHSQTTVTVTMQALKEEPSVLRCLDDFLVQCVAVPAGATVQDVTPEIFDKEAGHHVEEFKSQAASVASPVPEDSEETSENDTSVSSGLCLISKQKMVGGKAGYMKMVKDIMLMLTEEKQSIIQDINSRLKEEVELLKRDLTRNKGGSRLSIYYLLLIAVLSILLVHIFGSLMLSSDFS
ncbi:hypothetical protein DCAR_0418390 [Daucus carota subsp. sativus]|uniref:MSP domain-containing protein n=1 Tax=Daucus carota subsp. sativus TaxID=79200 RepID=A0AAF1AXE8_DAUCS|nr:hypothetical protein DCAR_0418390 [Daucus carota subsp. sativus]